MACGCACGCGIELGGGIGWSPSGWRCGSAVVIDLGWRGFDDVRGGCGIELLFFIGGRCGSAIVLVCGSAEAPAAQAEAEGASAAAQCCVGGGSAQGEAQAAW